MTLEDIKDKLKDYDAVTLIEILDLSVGDLVYYLNDVIEEKQDELREFFQDKDEEVE